MKAIVRRRILWFVIGVLAVWLLATSFQAAFWSRDFAQARALEEVTQFCLSTGRDPALLRSPCEDTFGDAFWSFEWHYDGEPRYLIGVWFSWDGDPEFYTGRKDDPSSAAYEPRRTPFREAKP